MMSLRRLLAYQVVRNPAQLAPHMIGGVRWSSHAAVRRLLADHGGYHRGASRRWKTEEAKKEEPKKLQVFNILLGVTFLGVGVYAVLYLPFSTALGWITGTRREEEVPLSPEEEAALRDDLAALKSRLAMLSLEVGHQGNLVLGEMPKKGDRVEVHDDKDRVEMFSEALRTTRGGKAGTAVTKSAFCGARGQVTKVDPKNRSATVQFDGDDMAVFPVSVLRVVHEPISS
eukprot:Sspe_Gene.94545::Locus_66918_Transcript_1_1_Confidence_1.000_Length_822::g.94545::m.94545